MLFIKMLIANMSMAHMTESALCQLTNTEGSALEKEQQGAVLIQDQESNNENPIESLD